MLKSISRYLIVKKKYLKFLKSQEILSEPFRNKIGQLNNFYIPICKKINESFIKNKRITIIGLTGGQGSGKSTISSILKIILKHGFNLNTVTFSIDDFYKTHDERKKMSKNISPLFLTRGVPGTHDTKLLYKCIKNLKSANFRKISLPRFDKSKDDRSPKKNWQRISKKPNIVIFEGWCVGVRPQKKKDLLIPINILEKTKDKKIIWRNRVNFELEKKYKKIFRLIDKIIFLKVPSFNHVLKWRLLQEKKLKITSKGNKTMNESQIRTFVMFYERLTRHMLQNFDKEADVIIKIDNRHKLKTIKFN